MGVAEPEVQDPSAATPTGSRTSLGPDSSAPRNPYPSTDPATMGLENCVTLTARSASRPPAPLTDFARCFPIRRKVVARAFNRRLPGAGDFRLLRRTLLHLESCRSPRGHGRNLQGRFAYRTTVCLIARPDPVPCAGRRGLLAP